MIEFVKQIADLSPWEFILFFTFSITLIIVFVYIFDTIVELIKGKSSEPNKSDENKTDK